MSSVIVPLLLVAPIVLGVLFALARPEPASAFDEGRFAESAAANQNAQLYWREIGQARDWEGLKAQLRRWQQLANPGWDEERIEEVARALNNAVFRFAEPNTQAGHQAVRCA
jgi:hypothetical protein